MSVAVNRSLPSQVKENGAARLIMRDVEKITLFKSSIGMRYITWVVREMIDLRRLASKMEFYIEIIGYQKHTAWSK